MRRQQYRRRRRAGGRHDGRARRRDPLSRRVPPRRQPCRARRAVGAHHPSHRRERPRMTFRIRPARDEDLQALYEMAKLTGGGFTNLPPDRDSLKAKLDRSHACFDRTDDTLADDLFVLVLENTQTKEVRGTCQIFTQVGQKWPFYSYRLGTLTQHSSELDRTFRADMLSLSTEDRKSVV